MIMLFEGAGDARDILIASRRIGDYPGMLESIANIIEANLINNNVPLNDFSTHAFGNILGEVLCSGVNEKIVDFSKYWNPERLFTGSENRGRLSLYDGVRTFAWKLGYENCLIKLRNGTPMNGMLLVAAEHLQAYIKEMGYFPEPGPYTGVLGPPPGHC